MASTQNKQVAAGLTGVAAVIAAILALLWGVASPQPIPPAPTTTTTTTTTTIVAPTTTGVVQADSVRRFASDAASWNQPVSMYGESTDLASYAKRWFDFGGGNDKPGSVNVAFGDYSIPFYDAKDATTTVRILQTTWAQALYTTPYLPIGSSIPWNPSWKPGTGNDNLMIIADYVNGQVWELGGVGQLPINCVDWVGPNAQVGFNIFTINAPGWLCTSGGSYNDRLYTAVDGFTNDGRGMGINKYIGIVRADEVKSGAIRHTMAMTITSTMFGPACDPVSGTSAPGFGVSCGGFVPPATKLERTNPNVGCAAQVVTDAERSKTVPEGMRFAIKISDPEIEAWLDSRGYKGPIRSTARVFAVGLRDYGWMIAETGCFGMHIETDGVLGPAGDTWSELGVKTTGSTYPSGDLIAGLITRGRVYVVNPPK